MEEHKMRSYLEILNELMETVESDIIPKNEKETIKEQIRALLDTLWKYSD
jgi:hypothetical protein